MNDKTNVRSRRINAEKHPAGQNRPAGSSKYNTYMKDDTAKAQQEFSERLSVIRSARGISAREMSLSLGQGAGYINNIENGRNLPSMAMFFEICGYLEISPRDFFDYPGGHDSGTRRMIELFEELDKEGRELITAISEKLRRG